VLIETLLVQSPLVVLQVVAVVEVVGAVLQLEAEALQVGVAESVAVAEVG